MLFLRRRKHRLKKSQMDLLDWARHNPQPHHKAYDRVLQNGTVVHVQSKGPQIAGRDKVERGMKVVYKTPDMPKRRRGTVIGEDEHGWHVKGLRQGYGDMQHDVRIVPRDQIWTEREHTSSKERSGIYEATSAQGRTLTANELNRRKQEAAKRFNITEAEVLQHPVIVSQMKSTLARLAYKNGINPNYRTQNGILNNDDPEATDLYSEYATAAIGALRSSLASYPQEELDAFKRHLAGDAKESRIFTTMTVAGRNAAIRHLKQRNDHNNTHDEYNTAMEDDYESGMRGVAEKVAHDPFGADETDWVGMKSGIAKLLNKLRTTDPVGTKVLMMKFALGRDPEPKTDKQIAEDLTARLGKKYTTGMVAESMTNALRTLATTEGAEALRGFLKSLQLLDDLRKSRRDLTLIGETDKNGRQIHRWKHTEVTEAAINKFIEMPRTDTKSGYALNTEEKGIVVKNASYFLKEYACHTRNNPMIGAFGHKIVFEPDKRAIDRLGANGAYVEYALHSLTRRPDQNSNERVFDGGKNRSVDKIGLIIKHADGWGKKPDDPENKLYYYKEIKTGKRPIGAVVLEMHEVGNDLNFDSFRFITFTPDKKRKFIEDIKPPLATRHRGSSTSDQAGTATSGIKKSIANGKSKLNTIALYLIRRKLPEQNEDLIKSHIKQYTRQDGTVVQEHNDKRVKKHPDILAHENKHGDQVHAGGDLKHGGDLLEHLRQRGWKEREVSAVRKQDGGKTGSKDDMPEPGGIKGKNPDNPALQSAQRTIHKMHEAVKNGSDPVATLQAINTSRANPYLAAVDDEKKKLLAHFGHETDDSQKHTKLEKDGHTVIISKDGEKHRVEFAGGDIDAKGKQPVGSLQGKKEVESVNTGKKEPKFVMGKENKAFTAKMNPVHSHYALVEADDLTTSHTIQGHVNKAYPQEIQPRERERMSSQMQMANMMNDIKPELFGAGNMAAHGAPIVGKDGAVESGNGRTIALAEAYKRDKADHYKDYLKQEAESFGLKPEDVEKMKNPVLVRVRDDNDPNKDRAEFAREANDTGNLGSSPAEQAWNDADRIDDALLKKYTVDEDGEVYNDNNMDFINGFLDKLGKNEAASLRDADGDPNKKCIERIQNAVFAKVYGSSVLTEFQAESAKPRIRNVLKALNSCVPDFAQSKQHDDLNVVPDIMESIEYYLAHQNESKAELEYKLKNSAELNFTGDAPVFKTELATNMILAIADRAGSRNRLENVFRAISNEIKTEVASRENPEVDMFSGPYQPKDKQQVVKQALDKVAKQGDDVQKATRYTASLYILRKSNGGTHERNVRRGKVPSQADHARPGTSCGRQNGRGRREEGSIEKSQGESREEGKAGHGERGCQEAGRGRRLAGAWLIKSKALKDRTTITVTLRDPDRSLVRLIQDIKRKANVGHSYEVYTDPDDRENAGKFGIDGDGPFHIDEIRENGELVKALQSGLYLLRKSKSGLTLIQEIDKNGHTIHRWKRGDTEHTEQVHGKLDFIDNGEPIATMAGNEIPMFKKFKELTKWVGEYWSKEYGGRATNPILGDVILDHKAADDSVGHGLGRIKAQAFYLVPHAIEKGVVLGELPSTGNKPHAYIIGAPVGIGDNTYKMFVEVRKDVNMQRMYIHEVVLRKKSPESAFESSAATSQGKAEPQGAHHGAIYNLLQSLLNSNFKKSMPCEDEIQINFNKSLRSGLWLFRKSSKTAFASDKSGIRDDGASVKSASRLTVMGITDSPISNSRTRLGKHLHMNSHNTLHKSELPSDTDKMPEQNDLSKAHVAEYDRVTASGALAHVMAHEDSRVKKYGDQLRKVKNHADLHKVRQERFAHLPHWGSLPEHTKEEILLAEEHLHRVISQFSENKNTPDHDTIDRSGWKQNRLFKGRRVLNVAHIWKKRR